MVSEPKTKNKQRKWEYDLFASEGGKREDGRKGWKEQFLQCFFFTFGNFWMLYYRLFNT